MEGKGRQLNLSDKIVDIKDSNNNTWYKDGDKIFLNLSKENRPRVLGKFRNGIFFCERIREKHLFRNSSSYGFCIEVLEQLNLDYIELYEKEGENPYLVYKFPMDVLRQFGEYLHFKTEGFEKQLFLSLAI